MEKQLSDQYFQGILQLRNPDKEIMNFVKKEVSKRNDMITQVKKVKNGIDLYFTSQRFLRSLGNKIQKNFAGELKSSRKLHTQDKQSGKKIYRVNVLFRLSTLKKGDTIRYKGDECIILSVKKDILVKNMKTQEKIHIKFKDL